MPENNIINQDVYITEDQYDVGVIETVEVIDVTDAETFTVDSFDAFPALGESNEYLKHQLLNGRELSDQHPITAITGLREELNDIEALGVVYSDKRNQANYYLWEDENILQENRIGYFVSAGSDINEIKICTSDNNIFGVTVDGAGFIGAQSDVARDVKYGLVVTTGIVHVRCESSVDIGDYVISNDYGYAQSNKNGYQVVGRHQIDGVEYAEIALVTPIGRMCELTNEVDDVAQRMDDAETNIAAAINVANAAYNKSNEVGEVSEEAIKNALEALNKSNETADKTNDMELSISSANEMAVQAKAISESASLSAERIRSEAVSTANNALSEAYKTQDNLDELTDEMTPLMQWEGENGKGVVGFVARANADSATLASLAKWEEGEGAQSIAGTIAKVNEHEAILDHITSHQGVNGSTIAQVEQKADDNGASITSLVSSVDKYSVGEYSQAYGLTREQAKNILKPGYVYIPTKHEDKQSHKEVFVGESEENEFTPGDYYVWGINDQGNADWIEHNVGSVWISNAIPANSNGTYKYWYLDSSEPISGYEAYSLYIWEDSQWKKVNTLAGNASNRAVSMIRQTVDNVAVEVTNARGEYSGLDARLTENEKRLSLVVKDGGVNSASIIMAINDDGSSVNIKGDHIVLNGATTNVDGSFQIHENGYMIATGGTVGGWNIGVGGLTSGDSKTTSYMGLWKHGVHPHNNSYIAMHVGSTGGTINTAPFRVYFDGSMYATKGQIGGWNISSTNLDTKYLFNQTINGVSETWTRHISIQSASGETSRAFAVREIKGDKRGNNPDWRDWTYRFYVENSGKLYAENAEIKGTITATAGKIGSWKIIPDPLNASMYILGTDFKKGNDYYGIGFRPLLLSHYINNNESLPVFAIGKFNSTWYADGDLIPSTGLDGNWDTADFFVTASGKLYAKDAEITGKVTATSGTIGGCSISNGVLSIANANISSLNVGKLTAGTNNKAVKFTNITATGGKIGNWSIDDAYLWGSVSDTYGTTKTYISPGLVSYEWTGYNDSTSNITSWTAIIEAANASDIRLKDNVEDVDDKYELLFDKLSPKTFNYKLEAQRGNPNNVHFGFVAQDVLSVQSDLDMDSLSFVLKEKYYSIKMQEFIALNTWQIQKAKARIAELEDRVAQLEALIKE